MELAIPHVRQSTSWSCGPASLTAVLRYYGHRHIRESVLIRRSGCNATGTAISGLIDASRSFGITPVYAVQGVHYETLCTVSALGNPVIAAIQAWHDGPIESYADVWSDGHFVVVTHADEAGVRIMDPSLAGRGYLEREEWLERWHDIDVGDRRVVNVAIIFPAAVVRRRRCGPTKIVG